MKHYTLAEINGATKEDQMPKVGEFAKLVFESPEGEGEGMWVKVTKVLPNLKFQGVLDNEPIVINAKLGAKVNFGWQHIRQVMS